MFCKLSQKGSSSYFRLVQQDVFFLPRQAPKQNLPERYLL
jgi:hypothetical protein